MTAHPSTSTVTATVDLARPGSPKEVHVKMRLPTEHLLQSATVNGRAAVIGGLHHDTVVVPTAGARQFEVVAKYS
jgi:hypothetical protein